MKIQLVEAASREEAVDLAPWASVVIPCADGWQAFGTVPDAERWLAQDCDPRLIDYETCDEIGPASIDQALAGAAVSQPEGIFCINVDGVPLHEDQAGPDDRRVFVQY